MATLNVGSGQTYSTIQAAINAASANDTVVVYTGTYNEKITINKNITVENNGTPRIRVSGSGYVVNITGDGATFDGFIVEHTQNMGTRDNLVEVSADNVTVKNCLLYLSSITDRESAYANRATGDRRAGIRLSYGENTLIENCEIKFINFGIHIPNGGGVNGVIRNCNIHHTTASCITIQPKGTTFRNLLIEGCNLNDSYIEDGIQWQGGKSSAPVNYGVYVRNCMFIANAENALDFKGASDIVIEKCVITRTIGSNDGSVDGWNTASGMAVMTGTGDICENVIIRDCVIYNNLNGILHAGKNAKTYNCTIIYNNLDWQGPDKATGNIVASGERKVDNVGIKNCIIGGHKFAGLVSTLENRDYDYNLYFAGRNGGSSYVAAPGNSKGAYPHHAITSQAMTLSQWQTRLRSISSIKGKEAHSMYVENHSDVYFWSVPDQPFGLPDAYDFRLLGDSPAYRSGGPLTFVTNYTSGNTIKVDDSRWFSDGFGATKGDRICVGDQQVTITNINHGTKTITVDKNIIADAGTGVYYGPTNRPHIGILSTVDNTPLPPEPDPGIIAADFVGIPRTGDYPLTVQFTNTSIADNTITSYSWKSNGSQFSTTQHPTHVFETADSFDISLTVTSSDGTSTNTKTDYIVTTTPAVIPSIKADFTLNKYEAEEGTNIVFYNQSTSTSGISTYDWKINGTTVSTSSSYSTMLLTAGLYTVSLTVTGPDGSDTETKTDILLIKKAQQEDIIVAEFISNLTSGVAPFSVQFTDGSYATNGISAWEWRANGEIFSTSQNPLYTFSFPGNYTISLKVTGLNGQDTITKTNYIVANEKSDPGTGGQLLTNGGFGDGKEGWSFHCGGSGNWEVVSSEAKFEISSTGGNTQLYQKDIQIDADAGYTYTVKARTSSGTLPCKMRVMMHDSPYTIFMEKDITLTTTEQTFTDSETSWFSYSNMRVTFLIEEPGEVFISDVVFGLTSEENPPTPPTPTASSVSRVVRVAANTSTGNQTISVTGITPNAAMFVCTPASSGDNPYDGDAFSMGFATSNGDQVFGSYSCQDNVSTSVIARRTGNDAVISIPDYGSKDELIKASIVSMAEDEIVINFSIAPATAFYIDVHAFEATEAEVGESQTNDTVGGITTATSAMSGTPDLVFGWTPASGVNNFPAASENSSAISSFGVATQANQVRYCRWNNRNQPSALIASYMYEDQWVGYAAGKYASVNLETDGFDIVTDAVESGWQTSVVWMALRFASNEASMIVDRIPSTSQQKIHNIGIVPGYIGVFQTMHDSLTSSKLFGHIGIGGWDGSTEISSIVATEEGSSPINSWSKASTTVIDIPQDDGTAGKIGEVLGGQSTNIVIDYTCTDTTEPYLIMWAIEGQQSVGSGDESDFYQVGMTIGKRIGMH